MCIWNENERKAVNNGGDRAISVMILCLLSPVHTLQFIIAFVPAQGEFHTRFKPFMNHLCKVMFCRGVWCFCAGRRSPSASCCGSWGSEESLLLLAGKEMFPYKIQLLSCGFALCLVKWVVGETSHEEEATQYLLYCQCLNLAPWGFSPWKTWLKLSLPYALFLQVAVWHGHVGRIKSSVVFWALNCSPCCSAW